ncbi:MAG: histidinol dehydrogenase, partial [Acidimicrobiia bacterium]
LFAPEHLELICRDAESLVSKVRNAGAIFVGPNSPVSLGDYLAGSNHTLPTMGAATWASGLRASLFQRASAVVNYDAKGLADALRHVQAFAEAEGLPNHARALEVRVERHSK